MQDQTICTYVCRGEGYLCHDEFFSLIPLANNCLVPTKHQNSSLEQQNFKHCFLLCVILLVLGAYQQLVLYHIILFFFVHVRILSVA